LFSGVDIAKRREILSFLRGEHEKAEGIEDLEDMERKGNESGGRNIRFKKLELLYCTCGAGGNTPGYLTLTEDGSRRYCDHNNTEHDITVNKKIYKAIKKMLKRQING